MVIAGHVLIQQRVSEIVFLTKFEERHKRCVSRILDPFPNILCLFTSLLCSLSSPTAAEVASANDVALFAFVLPPASSVGLWSHSNEDFEFYLRGPVAENWRPYDIIYLCPFSQWPPVPVVLVALVQHVFYCVRSWQNEITASSKRLQLGSRNDPCPISRVGFFVNFCTLWW